MPADPGMGSRVQRPRTSPTRLTARQAAGRPEEAGAGLADVPEEQDIELLEYEWPDLPPLPTIKDAITRSRVSYGISYLLPVDKGRNSINNRFRTDLRAMFQEPYASDDLQYDDNRVKLSAKVHFLSNSGDTKWSRRHLSTIPVHLNADSEKMRRLYAHSAPTGGTASRRMGIDPHKLRTRSNLFLPLKAAVPPELVKLRKEVDDIIKSVREDDEEFDEEQLMQTESTLMQTQNSTLRHTDTSHQHADPHHKQEAGTGKPRHSVMHHGKDPLMGTLGTSALAAKLQNIQVTPQKFESYKELKTSRPSKPVIPDSVKSQYLTDEQNQAIWDWLHHGEEMNDFDFFLSVCG